jgi:hypothetical protein
LPQLFNTDGGHKVESCVCMPRLGYSSITLPSELHRALREKARLYGTTPQGLIKTIVFDETFPKSFPDTAVVPGSNPGRPTTPLIYRV